MSGAWWHPAGDSEGPLIMGILNLTPDSFSDGGRYLAPDQALAHGLRMAEEGADIIDVGGESTRPGAERVPAAEQCRRVLEVIRALRAQLPDGVRISIDTSLGEVATAAVRAGADMLNDVSAGRDDPGIFALAANRGLPLVLMHMRGTPRTMQEAPRYDDVVEEVRQFLLGRVRAAVAAGVPEEQLVLDPGIGFGKTVEHNLALLRGLRRLATLGCPLLLGASRKRFMQAACGTVAGAELVGATCATTALGVWQDVRIVRVHDVRANRQAAALSWRLRQCAAGA